VIAISENSFVGTIWAAGHCK